MSVYRQDQGCDARPRHLLHSALNKFCSGRFAVPFSDLISHVLSHTNESVIELRTCIGSALSERVGLQEVGGFISKGESWVGVSHRGRCMGVTCRER